MISMPKIAISLVRLLPVAAFLTWAPHGFCGLIALQSDVPAVIKRVAGTGVVKTLDASKYTLRIFTFVDGRSPQVTNVKPGGVWQLPDMVYAREAENGKWRVGNISAKEPNVIEAQTSYDTEATLERAAAYQPLPKAPAGWKIREVVRLSDFPVRMASDGKGTWMYIAMTNGDVWYVDVVAGTRKRILIGTDYLRGDGLSHLIQGIFLDKQNRVYLSANERIEGETVMNEVTLFRAQANPKTHEIAKPKSWFKTSYPWGIGAFNHGISKIDIGPDGMMYVGSGSRTGAGEPGDIPHYSKAGETDITACLWRLDPKSENPKLEIYARGLRNPFAFCWNNVGEMFSGDHGPDADAPEELNLIKQGHHYGFPFQFSDWTKKPYPYTPDIPKGLKIDLPIANYGPAEGGSKDKPLYSWQPHAAPTGLVFLNKGFPKSVQGKYLVSLFGNLLDVPEAGFKLLSLNLTKGKDGKYTMTSTKFLYPVARPRSAC
ncbi:MAG: PQQ-dependent sugar dehydrogenase, partial [Chthonomonadales bacterium]